MGVDIELSGNKLRLEAWNKILGAWAEQRDDDPFVEAEFQSSGGDGHFAWLWRKGSIRGVGLTWNAKSRELACRLNVLSSRADWINAFTVLRAALKHGGGTLTIEGDEVGPDELTKERAIERATHDFVACAPMVARQGATRLPIVLFEVDVDGAELSACTRENFGQIEKRLADRIESYATAYRSGTMTLQSGHRLTSWARIPTLIDKRVDIVDLPVTDPMKHPSESVSLPLATLLELLGDQAVDLGSVYYLPEVSDDDAAAIDRFKQAGEAAPPIESIPPAFASGADAARAQSLDFSTPEGIKRVVGIVLESGMQGVEEDELEAQLVDGGLDAEAVPFIMAAVGIAFSAMAERKKPEKVIKLLHKELNMPREMSALVMQGVVDCLKKRAR